MLRSAAISRIQRGLGNRTDKSAEIISALQEAQRELEMGKTLPWFLVEHDATLTLTSGTNTINLPDDFIRPFYDEPLRYQPEDSDVEDFIPLRVFRDATETYFDDEAGGPKVYIIRDTDIRIFPTADATYTLTWSYYRKGVVLDTEVENEWLEHAPEVLIGLAGHILALDLRDAEGATIFQNMYQKARIALYAETIHREHQEPIYMGGGL